MSVFHASVASCPFCEADVSFDIVHSVNADRRPDIRDAILDGTFQSISCPDCTSSFRVSPEFTYLNQERRLWIAAFGAEDQVRWAEVEREAVETFDEAFGAGAPELARGIGDGLTRRVTFGWPALEEKLLLRERNLDDVTIELMKTAILQGGTRSIPLNGDVELRVVDVNDEIFVCVWRRISTEEALESMEVPRALYNEIAADRDAWDDLRSDLTQGMFVDLNRLLVPAEPA